MLEKNLRDDGLALLLLNRLSRCNALFVDVRVREVLPYVHATVRCPAPVRPIRLSVRGGLRF